MAFRGTYDHSLDVKNRLTVPARFRAELSSGIVLAKNMEPCVSIWPPDAYDAYTRRALEGLHPLSADAQKLKRFYAANSFLTELDSAGRVMLPPFLLEHASLAKDVAVVGNEDSLEIWDRAAWADYNAGLDEDVTKISEKLSNAA